MNVSNTSMPCECQPNHFHQVQIFNSAPLLLSLRLSLSPSFCHNLNQITAASFQPILFQSVSHAEQNITRSSAISRRALRCFLMPLKGEWTAGVKSGLSSFLLINYLTEKIQFKHIYSHTTHLPNRGLTFRMYYYYYLYWKGSKFI